MLKVKRNDDIKCKGYNVFEKDQGELNPYVEAKPPANMRVTHHCLSLEKTVYRENQTGE